MSISIKIDLEGLGLAQKTLDGIRRRSLDLAPPMRVLGEHMRRSIEKNFQAGGRPKPWPPSKRVSLGGRGKTLIDTGWLKNYIGYQATANDLTIGTNVKYARMHHLGGPAHDVIIRPKKPGGVLAIPVHGSTLIAISPKTGRALTKKGKPGIIFRREVTLKAGSIPQRRFLMFQNEDVAYGGRVVVGYVLFGREGMRDPK